MKVLSFGSLLCGSLLHLSSAFLKLSSRHRVVNKSSYLNVKIPVDAPAVVDEVDYTTDIQRTVGWVAAAGAFAGGIAYFKGADSAIEFCSGYALEQCLSVDNLFVFIVLFDYFKVERMDQSKVLKYGIIGGRLLL